MGFSRQEYRSGLPIPSPGDLSHPGIEPRSPALQADSLPSEPLRSCAFNPFSAGSLSPAGPGCLCSPVLASRPAGPGPWALLAHMVPNAHPGQLRAGLTPTLLSEDSAFSTEFTALNDAQGPDPIVSPSATLLLF